MSNTFGYEHWEDGFELLASYSSADEVDLADVEFDIMTTCQSMQDVGEVGESGYTYTSDFNYYIWHNGIPDSVYYLALGSGDITSRDCEAVDCLHPCYGDDAYGACAKCIDFQNSSGGDRHDVCDLCVV